MKKNGGLILELLRITKNNGMIGMGIVQAIPLQQFASQGADALEYLL